MFPTTGITITLNEAWLWIAQIPRGIDIDSPSEASVAITGPKFFIALIAGVILAFGLQMLMTNLGLAVGLTAMGGHSSSAPSTHPHSESLGHKVSKASKAIGAATMITVSLALFGACWMAVELSLIATELSLGAIMGLVIWATYFILLMWVSSSTVGSAVGSIINTATSGFQSLFGIATSLIGGAAAKRQIVTTAESAASAVRREITAGMDPLTIRENLEDYIETLRPPQPDWEKVRHDIQDLFHDPRFQELASSDLGHINRQTFADLVSSRSDLSKREINILVNLLENAWGGVVSKLPSKSRFDELKNYIKEATPDQLVSDEFTQKIDDLVKELRKRREVKEKQGQQNQPPGIVHQAVGLLMGQVMGRTDLSDLSVSEIVGKLQQAKDQVTEQADKVKSQVTGEPTHYSMVRADVENYLLNVYSWQMTYDRLRTDFRDVIYDQEASPGAVAHELEQLHRSDFADILRQRGVFTKERIREISSWLEDIRLEALATAYAAQEQAKSLALFRRVESYLLLTPQEDLTPEKIQLNFRDILEDPDADYDHLETRLAQFDRITLERLLNQRSDLNPAEIAEIVTELEKARDRVLDESREAQEAVKAKAEAQWLKLASYLRDTGKEELDPQGIKQDVQKLIDDPTEGIPAIRARVSRFDRDTLVQLLSQQENISEEQVNEIIDQIESVWTRMRSTQQQFTGKAKEQYDHAMNAIADYLRNTGKDELNPKGIQQDLQLLLDHPKLGAQAIRMRLSEVDRDTFVQLLSQREDLSEEEANQIIDSVQQTLQRAATAPRRLALRAKDQVVNFEQMVEDYLRNTEKDELNPEGIKRDLQQLIHDPRAGATSLGERLSHFDRSTMIALLSERQDISEEEAARYVDQILSVREQITQQFKNVQQQIQSVVDSIFDRIRNYLNSLERPELNYEGIKRDVQTLFDDPQAGFDALRDRLSHFDRDTLVAIVSSREDISEADVNRIIDQIEHTRNRLIQRAERMQRATEERIEQMKYEAQHQLEETRKAAASAARWLFAIAFVSALAACAGGIIAVAL